MDRERTIQELVAVLATLEKCSEQDVEKVKRFLRWMSDEALLDMRDKHRKALENMTMRT